MATLVSPTKSCEKRISIYLPYLPNAVLPFYGILQEMKNLQVWLSISLFLYFFPIIER